MYVNTDMCALTAYSTKRSLHALYSTLMVVTVGSGYHDFV